MLIRSQASDSCASVPDETRPIQPMVIRSKKPRRFFLCWLSLAWAMITWGALAQEALVREDFGNDPVISGRFIQRTDGTESSFRYDPTAQNLTAVLDVDQSPAYFLSQPFPTLTDKGDTSFSVNFRVDAIEEQELDPPVGFIGVMTDRHVDDFGDGLTLLLAVNNGSLVANANIDATTNNPANPAIRVGGNSEIGLKPGNNYLAVGRYAASSRQFSIEVYEGQAFDRLVGFTTATVPPNTTLTMNRLGLQNGGAKKVDRNVGSLTVTVDNLFTPARNPNVITLENAKATLEGDPERPGQVVFPVHLWPATSLPVTVPYVTTDDSAKAGIDYQGQSGTLTFSPGTTESTITVPILGDRINEPDRGFWVSLRQPVNAALSTNLARAIILDDDALPRLILPNATVVEGDQGFTNLVFDVQLSEASGQVIRVDYETRDESAKAGLDYVSTPGSFTLEPGRARTNITIRVIGDTLEEAAQKTFLVVVTSWSNVNVTNPTARGTILDNDTIPWIQIANALPVAEGPKGTPTNAVFKVSLSSSSGKTVRVSYTVADGTTSATNAAARVGVDVKANSGDLVFAPGMTETNIQVVVSGNDDPETDRNFRVLLFNPANAGISTSEATGWIWDDDPKPVITIANSSLIEGDSGFSEMIFTIALDKPSKVPVSVHYTNQNGTAIAGRDYVGSSGVVPFATNKTTAALVIQVINNLWDEPDRTFSVVLDSPANAVLGQAKATGLIVDNDPPPQIQVAGARISEGDTGVKVFALPVSLSRPSGRTVSVSYATEGGSATTGADFLPAVGSVSFPPGTTNGEIPLRIAGDTLYEDDETFYLLLSQEQNATLATRRVAIVISNDDKPPALAISRVSDTEGDTGQKTFEFKVNLTSVSGKGVTVNFHTVDGTAKAGSDYVANTGSLTFLPGQVLKTIPVAVIGDGIVEPDEDFYVVLADAVNATVATASGRGLITNDDQLKLSIGDASVTEPENGAAVNLVFPVRLSAAGNLPVSVAFRTQDISTHAGADYVAANGGVQFAPGELTKQIAVAVNGDLEGEGDEAFKVVLSQPVNAILSVAEGTGTIHDRPPPRLSISDASVPEGPTGTVTRAVFIVSLTRSTSNRVTVEYATAGVTARAGSDYIESSGVLAFAPGETSKQLVVVVNGDDQVEGNETLKVVLSHPTNAVLDQPWGMLTIVEGPIPDPCVSIQDASVQEGALNTVTGAVFYVSLSKPGSKEVSVQYATVEGTARAGKDYAAASGVLRFAPGELSKTITVGVYGDEEIEGTETFQVRLSNPVNATLTNAVGAGTIVDRIPPPALTIADTAVRRGSPNTQTGAVFTVSLSRAGSQEVTVAYATVDGSARAGTDYVATNGVLRFAPGQTTQTVVVWVKGGAAAATNLAFGVDLSEPSQAVISGGRGRGVIWSVAPTPKIQLSFLKTIQEGRPGTTTNAVFQVGLAEASPVNVTVKFTTADGTAQAGADYAATNGVLTFAPGELMKEARVTVNGDLKKEGDETFSFQLSEPGNAVLKDSAGLVTIRDYVPDLRIVAAGTRLVKESYDPADGQIEPQEIVEVEFGLKNAGADDTSGLQAQLVAEGGGLTPLSGTQAYGVLLAGGAASAKAYRFQVSGRGGESFAARLHVWDGDWELGYVTNWMQLGPESDLDLKASGTPAALVVGQSLRYEVVVTNAGPSAATGVVLTSRLGSGLEVVRVDQGQGSWTNQAGTLTGQLGEVAVGGVIRCVFEVIPRQVPLDGQLIGYFGVQAREYDSQRANNVAKVITEVRPPIGIYIEETAVKEGDAGTTNAVFTLWLNPATNRVVSVDYTTRDGSATAPADYAATSGRLVFAPGVTRTNITVMVKGEVIEEEDETFWVQLSNPVNTSLTTNLALGIIRDDDTRGLAIDDAVVTKPAPGTVVSLVFRVSLSLPSSLPISVAFATADGSARAGWDYQATNGVLRFGPGELVKTVAVVVNGNAQVTGTNTLSVVLSHPENAILDKPEGVGTILEEIESEPGLSIQDTLVHEGMPNTVTGAVFVVRLGRSATREVTVEYATLERTAQAGRDYAATNGVLRFAPGELSQSITVEVYGDEAIEGTETFQMRLSNPVNAILTNAVGVGTIMDRVPPPALTIADTAVQRGLPNAFTRSVFTVSLNRSASQEVTVAYATADGSARAGTDYVATNGVLRFAPGQTNQTVVVWAKGGAAVETSLEFWVNLSEPVQAVISDGQGRGLIWSVVPPPQILLSYAKTIQEGPPDTATNALFQVSLSETSPETVTVKYATVDGTAQAGADYVAANGRIEFAPGEWIKEVRVAVNGDLKKEGDETFSLQLSEPVNGTVKDTVGRVTIRDYVPDLMIVSAGTRLTQESYDPADGQIEPQEIVEVEFGLRNAGVDATSNLEAQLVAEGGKLTPLSGTQVYGVLPAGGAKVVKAYRFQVSGRGGESFAARLHVWDGDWELGYVTNWMQLGPESDLDLKASGTPAALVVGQSLRYEVVVTNGGQSAATGVVLTSRLGTGIEVVTVVQGQGTWTNAEGKVVGQLGELAVGGVIRCAFEVIPRKVPVDGQVISYFGVQGREYDSQPANNQAAVLTEVGPPIGGIYIEGTEVKERDVGTTNAVFIIWLNPATNRVVSVDYTTRDGTAIAPADYIAKSGRLVIPPGVIRTNITVAVQGDVIEEADETFWVQLSNPVNANLTTNLALGIIQDDDPRKLTINDAIVTEPTPGTVASLVFSVSLLLPSSLPVNVAYATMDGTARAGLDYQATNGVLRFAPGEVARPVTVVVNGDDQAEGTETFKVVLSHPENAILAKPEGVGTIIEGVPLDPNLSIQDASIQEGPPNTVTGAVFVLSLSRSASREVTVNYTTVGGTAQEGRDYAATNGMLRFAPGQLTQTITVGVYGDGEVEGTETFQVRLSNPVNVTLTNAVGVGTIVDRIPPPALTIANAAVQRGLPNTLTGAVFTVSLNRPASQEVAVAYATADGSARAGTDYVATNGVLRFAPGQTNQTVVVWAKGGAAVETSLEFWVNLSEPVQAVISGGQGRGLIRSVVPPPQILLSYAKTIQEGPPGTATNALFQVSLAQASPATVTVKYTTVDETAQAGADYVAANGRIEFAPDEWIKEVRVVVNGDLKKEGDETFSLQLSEPVNGTVKDAVGRVTIRDYVPDLEIIGAGTRLTQESYDPADGQIEPQEIVEVEFGLRNAGVDATSNLEAQLVAEGGKLTPLSGTQVYAVLPVGGAKVVKAYRFQVNGRGGESFAARLHVWDGDWELGYVTNWMRLGPESDLDLKASGTPAALVVGQVLRYEVVVTNGGPSTATGVVLTSRLGAGLEVVAVDQAQGTWTNAGGTLTGQFGEVAVGGVIRCVFEVIPRQVPLDGQLIGYFGVQAREYDSQRANNVAKVMTEVGPPIGIYFEGSVVKEGDVGTTNALFAVTLNPPTNRVVSVDYTTRDGTATAPADYAATSGRLVFPPGVTRTNISVMVKGDLIQEDDETFWVQLSNPVNASLATNLALGLIRDNDPPGITINDVTVNVGTNGSALAWLEISLSSASDQLVTVDYQTENGTATSGNDYAAKLGSLSFPPGRTRTNISILISGNTFDEATEFFYVRLFHPANATLMDDRGTVTITDDPPAIVSINDVTLDEGDKGLSPAIFTVSLASPMRQSVTLEYATADGTARAPTDYLATNGVLVFPAGVVATQVTVWVVGNTRFENAKLFYVNLANATFARSQGSGTIRNDDPANTASLHGQVRDALNDQALSGVLVEAGGRAIVTDADGSYWFTNIPPGSLKADFDASVYAGEAPLQVQFINYTTEAALTVQGSKNAYIGYVNSRVQVREGETVRHDFSMSPVLAGLRLVLNWGERPRDLDAHLLTPVINGKTSEISYLRRGATNAPPYANLDVDHTDSFGPETITISRLMPGSYRYFVRNYKEEQGDTGPLILSAAVVQIYTERGLIRTVNVPVSGEGDYWDVCSINGDTGEVTVINTLRIAAPLNDPLTGGSPVPGDPPGSNSSLSYEWNFGDGNPSREFSPKITFSTPGDYDVSLTATTGDQERNAILKRGFIHVEPGANAMPRLIAKHQADQVLLEWDSAIPGCILESATNLATPDWVPVDYDTHRNRFSIVLPVRNARFFRLKISR